MKKNKINLKALAISIAILFGVSSCSDAMIEQVTEEQDQETNNGYIEQVNIFVDDFVPGDEQTRASYTATPEAVSFAWDSSDKIGIAPVYRTDGTTVNNPEVRSFVVDQTFGSTAVFDGGDWAMRRDRKYSAYYPYLPSSLSKTSFYDSYNGYTYHANSPLKNSFTYYDFMYAEPTLANDKGFIDLHFVHISSLVKFDLTLPSAEVGQVLDKLLIIDNNRSFKTMFSYSILDNFPRLQHASSSNSSTFEINLTSVKVDSDHKVTVYALLPPDITEGDDIDIKIQDIETSKTWQVSYKASQSMYSNHAYTISKTLTAAPTKALLNYTDFRDCFFQFVGDLDNVNSIEFRSRTELSSLTTNASMYRCIDVENSPFPVYVIKRVTNSEGKTNFIVCTKADEFALPSNCYKMFEGFSSLKSITGLNVVNTEGVESMAEMFCDCNNLQSLDLSNFKTYNVTDMNRMFQGCANLTSLDLSKFNTSKVESMQRMFAGCKALNSLNISSFNTSNVTDMSHMFYACNTLPSLYLDHFDTSKVTNMNLMFSECNSLGTLSIKNFSTTKLQYYQNMFYLTAQNKTSANRCNLYIKNALYSMISESTPYSGLNENVFLIFRY